MLALAEGIGALLIAVWGLDTILAFMPFNMPGFVQIEIDTTVLCFTGAIALLTGLLFGIGPALEHSHLNMNATLKDGAARTVARGDQAGAYRVFTPAESPEPV